MSNVLKVVGWVVVGAGVLVGCARPDGAKELTVAPQAGGETAAVVAHAKAATYPAGVKASDEMRVTAVVSRKKQTITLRNFGDQKLKDVNVWVNGAWVRKVDTLPARGSVAIHFGQFYDAKGTSWASQNRTVGRVQLEVKGKLYNALGPAYE